MSKRTGTHHAISYFRRIVVDLMYFSAGVPSVTIERRMNLAPLLAARLARTPRPSWTALFSRAYGLVAAKTPALRTSYMKFPWPHYYTHSGSIAAVNLDRDAPGERVVLQLPIRRPENRTVDEIDAIIRRNKEEPVETNKTYQRALRLSKVPFPLRQIMWWAALNVFGRRRCHTFGTFGITSIAALGAGVVQVFPLLTSTLHYGLFDAAGNIDMRLSLDHRVLDGVTAANTLADLETTLLGTILREIQAPPQRAAA